MKSLIPFITLIGVATVGGTGCPPHHKDCNPHHGPPPPPPPSPGVTVTAIVSLTITEPPVTNFSTVTVTASPSSRSIKEQVLSNSTGQAASTVVINRTETISSTVTVTEGTPTPTAQLECNHIGWMYYTTYIGGGPIEVCGQIEHGWVKRAAHRMQPGAGGSYEVRHECLEHEKDPAVLKGLAELSEELGPAPDRMAGENCLLECTLDECKWIAWASKAMGAGPPPVKRVAVFATPKLPSLSRWISRRRKSGLREERVLE